MTSWDENALEIANVAVYTWVVTQRSSFCAEPKVSFIIIYLFILLLVRLVLLYKIYNIK